MGARSNDALGEPPLKILLWITLGVVGLFVLIGLMAPPAPPGFASSPSYGYGSGATGTWSLTIFTDGGGPITQDGFPSRAACESFAATVAQNLRTSDGTATAARIEPPRVSRRLFGLSHAVRSRFSWAA
jgi:hypothetical protein